MDEDMMNKWIDLVLIQWQNMTAPDVTLPMRIEFT
jgi:hypothetical protein